MSTPLQLRALYRSLLRELPPRQVTSPKARSSLHIRLREMFTTKKSHQHAVAQTHQLVRYLAAQRQYTTLLERYNPGMNIDEEERVRLTARRVGMDLPIEYARLNSKS